MHFPPYPLFIPPGTLGEKTPPEWSRREAEEYGNWLQSCIPDRVGSLIRYFGMDETAPSSSLLESLGQRVAEALVHEPFSEDGRLTNQGHALAADMGLLLAVALKRENTELTWEIVRKPKSDVDYHQPVLVGFPDGVPCNPVHISTMQAFGVLNGNKDGTAWRRIFKTWNDFVRRA